MFYVMLLLSEAAVHRGIPTIHQRVGIAPVRAESVLVHLLHGLRTGPAATLGSDTIRNALRMHVGRRDVTKVVKTYTGEAGSSHAPRKLLVYRLSGQRGRIVRRCGEDHVAQEIRQLLDATSGVRLCKHFLDVPPVHRDDHTLNQQVIALYSLFADPAHLADAQAQAQRQQHGQ